MNKLDEWITKPMTQKQLDTLACKNGSITCGLRQKLGTGKCDNDCKQRMILLNEIIKVMGTGKVNLREIFDKIHKLGSGGE